MRLDLYWHALRAIRPRQARGRIEAPIRRRWFPTSAPRRAFLPVVDLESFWRSGAFATADGVLSDRGRDVLGVDVPLPPPWPRLEGASRLRRFHLHYGDEALGLARAGDESGLNGVLQSWIGANPPQVGDAWHPYVVSTRIANWIAALTLSPGCADSRVVESLQLQLAYLERNVENGVLGNHVIRNATALLLGGRALGDSALRYRGISLIEREVPQQVLADGGHYERSPVYHAIVLRDLDVCARAVELESLAGPLERMRMFSAALARPDGAPALFNDGWLNAVPMEALPPPEQGLSVFPETGYAVLRTGSSWLAFDCGPPAPSFLPAHAHADALSVQLWRDGEPVIVDPGMPTYEAGPERDWFRSTRAHSTVCVGRGQFESWGAFRSGPLPEVELVDASPTGFVGRVRDRRGNVHERSVSLDGDRVQIHDAVRAPAGTPVVSTLVVAGEAAAALVRSDGAFEQEPREVADRYDRRRAALGLVAQGVPAWVIG